MCYISSLDSGGYFSRSGGPFPREAMMDGDTEWIDISVPITEGMATWPGDPPVVIGRVFSIGGGDDVNLSRAAPGEYRLFCLPLNIPDAEAAPARVLLQRTGNSGRL